MKKVMVFIGGYLPGHKYGGPVTSIKNFSDCLGDDYEIKIVCSNHDFKSSEPYENIGEGWNRVGKADVLYLPDREIKYRNILEILREEKPDIIYGSGIMYIKVNYGIFKAARKMNVPVLLAPRGDICDNAIRIKSWKKLPFLFLARAFGIFDGIYFHATVDEEKKNLKKYLAVDESRVYLLPNLPAGRETFARKDKKAGALRIVFVSRIQRKKNLLDAIKAVNMLSCDAVFDIYGPIEEEAYMNICEKEVKKAPKNVEIRYKGALSANEAGKVFSDYDCFLFPTWTENYGHVIAEALENGCPIILSRGTTPWDDIHEKAGFCIEQGDIEGYRDALTRLADMDEREYADFCRQVENYRASHFDNEKLKKDYMKMIRGISG